jgi:hypothetical protein
VAIVLAEPAQEGRVTLKGGVAFIRLAVAFEVLVAITHGQSLQKSAMTRDRRPQQAHT